MVNVLRRVIPGWPVLRAALVLSEYMGFVFALLLMFCVAPAHALISTTGYARVITQSAFNAYKVASASLAVSTISPAVAAATTGSVALRMVAGPLGWASLGVSAGLVLGQIYYSNSQVQQMQSAAAGPAPWSIPGYTNTFTGSTTMSAVTDPYYSGLYDFSLSTAYAPYPPAANATTCQYLAMPGGWTGPFAFQGQPCVYFHSANSAYNGTDPSFGVATPATPAQIQTYVGGLPATDPNSIASNTTQVGVGVSPQSATSVVSQNVDPASLPSTVVVAATVPATSIVVDPSAPAPPGTQTQTVGQTTTTTTTSTTTTDPQTGVTTTTKTDDDVAVSSCTSGEHDSRTLGTILQTHIDTWKGSGIAGALSTLQLLTWPSASPTYTLNSVLLGTFSFDFTAWNGILLALRSLIIAGASFAAYRIVFVGGSGGSD